MPHSTNLTHLRRVFFGNRVLWGGNAKIAWKAATIITVGWAKRNLRNQTAPHNRLKGGTKLKVSPFRREPSGDICRMPRYACIRLWLLASFRRFWIIFKNFRAAARTPIIRLRIKIGFVWISLVRNKKSVWIGQNRLEKKLWNHFFWRNVLLPHSIPAQSFC